MIIERTESPQWTSNAYLVADREGGRGILIDGNGVVEPLIARAQELDVDVVAVIVTHWHDDHIAGIDRYPRALASGGRGDHAAYPHPRTLEADGARPVAEQLSRRRATRSRTALMTSEGAESALQRRRRGTARRAVMATLPCARRWCQRSTVGLRRRVDESTGSRLQHRLRAAARDDGCSPHARARGYVIVVPPGRLPNVCSPLVG